MIALSSSLSAHQKLPNRSPVLTVTARAERAGQLILRWERLYTGAEADHPHAATLADDGSLVRARNAAGTLYVSRVTTPGAGSTYSSWTSLTTGLSTGSAVALASRNGELLLAYSTGTALLLRTSSDDGASWSSATTVVTEASNLTTIAATFNPNGDACLFYGIAGSATTLKRLRRTSGSWAGSGTNWSRSADVASVTGVAATHDGGDFVLVVTGTAVTTTHRRAWACWMGDLLEVANTWSTLNPIAEADSASGTSFAAPAILLYGSRLRATIRQAESGNVAFNRAMETHPIPALVITGGWAEPWPHEATSAYGLALAASSTHAWATTTSGVWRAALPGTSDLSARVLSCSYRLAPSSAKCTIELDNADGALAAAPNATFPALMVGGALVLQPGYRSGAAAAAEYGLALRFTVDRLTYQLVSGRRTVRVDASGAWEQAARFVIPQAWQAAAAATARSAIFLRLASRARLTASSTSTSTDWTTNQPGFAVTPGETAASAMRRLLAVVTDGVRTGENTADFAVVGRPTSPAAAAAFGGAAEHPITSISLVDEPPPANWLRLQGPDRYADALDLASIAQHGAQLRTLRNLDAGSDLKASGFAAAARRRDELEEPLAELVCPFHAGVQLFDPLSITAAGLGLSPTTYRVLSTGLEYRRGPTGARYDSVLTLGQG